METILFMIIVGVISTIFGKAKNNQKQWQKKPHSIKGMDELRTLFDEVVNPSRQTVSSPAVKTEEQIKTSERNLEKEFLQVRRESEASRIGRAASRQQAESLDEQKRKTEERETVSLEDQEGRAIINGIIWSEILAEPRSKRPFNGQRRF